MEDITFDDIYQTLIGVRTLGYAVPGVENAFAPDGYCQRQYENMNVYRERLWERLNSPDDEDVEHILMAMEAIQQELCRKIFAYALSLER